MGKKKGYTPFKGYETVNSHLQTEQHVRLTYSFLTSEAYNDLNKNAIKLYIAMKLVSKGKEEFQFSASLGLKYLNLKIGNESTVRKAIKELISHGFIRPVKFSNGRRWNS